MDKSKKEGISTDKVENALADYFYLQEITSHLPVGICKVAVDDSFTLLHGNSFFYELYGYTRQEMCDELNNEIARTVYREDLEMVREQLFEALSIGYIFNNEHRVVRKDGSMSWVLVRGSFAKEGEQDVVYCVTMDIGQRKFYEQELRINEERFRLALAQTDNTIFDYDIEKRQMIHANKAGSMYGIENITENVPDSLVENGIIHPDTTNVFLEMYGKIRSGEPSASCEIKTRLVGGKYVWRKISMTNIYDNEGRAVRAIGMLEDIDEQKKREESLRNKSERDPLTGIYNRSMTEKCIQNFADMAEKGAKSAMCIFDIDDFKGVNDRFGHLFGDKVLAECALRVEKLFGDGAICGRVGGDEFVVFVKDIAASSLKENAQMICEAFSRDFESGGIIASITCSVGASLFPQDGKTFEELYGKADIALYEAKNAGRNRAFCYRKNQAEQTQT